ncbi:MAG: ABC transporter substrate-binding protein [Micrococcaceae bacterium]|nr:ABC transporter substrate-binding protein [Micrococcaceae bacterium]
MIGSTVALALLVGAALATLWVPAPFGPAAAAEPAGGGPGGEGNPASQLRLGYFGNVTHAPALVGIQRGFLARELAADGTGLRTQVYNAGPAAVEALNAGAIDAAYLGPTPAIGSYTSSAGRSLKVVAGATSGGAQLVVRQDITSPARLRGTVLASPQLGGTQDVALRSWLADQGYVVAADGSGDVDINPTDNSRALALFKAGRIDGAWLPEPWASRLVLEAGARVLVDERDLRDGSPTARPGHFPSTVLVVDADFAAKHPDTVTALVAGNAEAVSWLQEADAAERVETINAGIEDAAGARLPDEVLARALDTTDFTTDPFPGAFDRLLEQGVAAGVTRDGSLDGLFDPDTTPPKGTRR